MTVTVIAIKVDQDRFKEDSARAEKLAARFELPLESDLQSSPDILFGWEQDKLALFPDNTGPVFIDFAGGRLAHRRQFGGGKKQPLARAIGLSSKVTPSVIDATAGMGRDSFVLACFGCQVRMIERSPIVTALLEDALLRASQITGLNSIAEAMSVICADAAEHLLQAPPADVIYLDPMYPEKRKSAAVKKDMQVLQSLVGPDLDSDKLLEVALEKAIHRVVVKRPSQAKPLTERKPDTVISSPNTRYDIYTKKSFSSAK